nr:MAG TPA: hypothetical protein [Caudoviricetes sp.]
MASINGMSSKVSLTAVKVSNPTEVNKPRTRCEFRGWNQ